MDTEKKFTTVKISLDVRSELARVQGAIERREGRTVPLSEVVHEMCVAFETINRAST